MKIKYHIISILLLIFGLGATFASCSNDDNEVNEWSATYVYLQQEDYLLKPRAFNLSHNSDGVQGDEVLLKFKVKTQKPVNDDLILKLNITAEGCDPSILQLSTDEPLIKAGERESEEIIAKIEDLSQLGIIEDKATFSFIINAEKIETTDCNTLISKLQSKISIIINKSAYSNLNNGYPLVGKQIKDRSNWKIQIQEGVENEGSNLIDGNKWTDIARNNDGYWFTIDLLDVHTLTGIITDCWGGAYAPQEVEIYQSKDGLNWKSLGVIATSGATQPISFISPISTRYIKYQITKVAASKRTSITEVNLYETE